MVCCREGCSECICYNEERQECEEHLYNPNPSELQFIDDQINA